MSKRILAIILAMVMAVSAGSALAVDDTDTITAVSAPSPSAWAIRELFEAEAYKMVESSDYVYYLRSTVTQSALDRITEVLAAKLALLGLEENTGELTLTLDFTREGVMNALYQEAARYTLDGIEAGPVEYLRSLGVVKGDGVSLALDRECTLQEALCMGQRLLTAVYDQCSAGSAGLLWKAVNGGNTLYLLGTVHVDRGNIYPFDHSLREAIDSADAVYFEVDFGDAAGLLEYYALIVYSDGTTLKDHVSEEVYAYAVELGATVGMTEEVTAAYKPWFLATLFSSLISSDDTAGDSPLAIDMYIYYRALLSGQEIGQVESYGYQAELFDSLSAEYQESYLYSSLYLYEAGINGEDTEDAETAEAYNALLDAYIELWKTRDTEGFSEIYDKDAILASGDELNVKLFEDRDPAMIEAAAALLEAEGENTFILVVGAGHMVGGTGIVQGLIDLGYEVEVVAVG